MNVGTAFSQCRYHVLKLWYTHIFSFRRSCARRSSVPSTGSGISFTGAPTRTLQSRINHLNSLQSTTIKRQSNSLRFRRSWLPRYRFRDSFFSLFVVYRHMALSLNQWDCCVQQNSLELPETSCSLQKLTHHGSHLETPRRYFMYKFCKSTWAPSGGG